MKYTMILKGKLELLLAIFIMIFFNLGVYHTFFILVELSYNLSLIFTGLIFILFLLGVHFIERNKYSERDIRNMEIIINCMNKL